ncbi:hypothetical protein GCM10022221_02100 [Actinocorallia aurea]
MREGTELSGRYKLTALLGRGGMGEVWAADDLDLGRPVAIKIVLAGLQENTHLSARFTREARTVARLEHPGITAVYDIGAHDGRPFFVMQLLQGTDFKALLERHPSGLPVDRAVSLMARVADALAYAHAHGVVHRDIKPANLMELSGGGVKICDFGISRQDDATMTLTTPGAVMGTPAYMAPEQYRAEEPDARTDLYAFGCTLYALLTGGPPFPGTSQHVLMNRHLNESPPSMRSRRPDIPRELDALVLRLLAKDPAGRAGSAAEIASALDAITQDAITQDAITQDQPRTKTPQTAEAGRDEEPSPPRAASAPESGPPSTRAGTGPAKADAPAEPGGPAAALALAGLVTGGVLSYVLHRTPVAERLPLVADIGGDTALWRVALAFVEAAFAAFFVFAVTMSVRWRRVGGFVVAVAAYPALEVLWRGLPWYLELLFDPLYVFFAFALVSGVMLSREKKTAGG